MNTVLDVAHDWVLQSTNYCDDLFTVHLIEETSPGSTRKATVQFDSVFLHLIAEDAQDSVWNDGTEIDTGFIKKNAIAYSKLSKGLNFTFWPFYEKSSHFVLVTRHEIIHVFCIADPVVTVVEPVN